MTTQFHPFVLPFTIGAAILFCTIIYKFTRWIQTLDRKQYHTAKRTFMTSDIFPALWKMIKDIFKESLLHIKVSKINRRLGYMHRSIAFGWFLLIVVGLIETIIHFGFRGHAPWTGVFYRFFVYGNNNIVQQVFATIMDLLLLYVLSGVTMAFIKSHRPKTVGMRKTTVLRWSDRLLRYALWSIFPLRLLSETMTATLHNNGGIITQTLGNLIPLQVAELLEVPLWSLYSIALCIFFVFMPYSRFMHIFTEPLLIFLKSFGVKESKQPTGFTKTELSACSRCGICIDVCPLNNELNINNIQAVYLLRGLRHGLAYRYAATNCLLCGRCVEACPVGIDIDAIRLQARNKKRIDLRNNYTYIKERPFNAVGRVAFFGGCMSHLTPNIQESMKKIFQAVGQDYWIMDEERTICCGRPLEQQGFSNQAAELRRKNTAMIIESHATMLITSCPICYRSFTQEYHLPIKVMHHTEYIAMLIEKGLLSPEMSDLRIAYHDPCELGRGCGIYDEPRQVLSTVGTLTNVPLQRENSLCCGCNLGNTRLQSTQQLKVRDTTLNNLNTDHPDLIATACPMCKKAFQQSTTQRVADVAELVAQQIKNIES
ncbi:MAG: (Fe-S)-binding protein [Bacteroidales bacterium]|nr:(Fe-S)-binding protein [Bacteroidales bacterium]